MNAKLVVAILNILIVKTGLQMMAILKINGNKPN
jgi:hypothetical protein